MDLRNTAHVKAQSGKTPSAAHARVAAALISSKAPLVSPFHSRVRLLTGDALSILATGHGLEALSRARVVFCNNFANRWDADGFQQAVFRLLSRVMAPGSILVSACRLTRGTRKSGLLEKGGETSNGGQELYSQLTLYFEVCGGWAEMIADMSAPRARRKQAAARARPAVLPSSAIPRLSSADDVVIVDDDSVSSVPEQSDVSGTPRARPTVTRLSGLNALRRIIQDDAEASIVFDESRRELVLDGVRYDALEPTLFLRGDADRSRSGRRYYNLLTVYLQWIYRGAKPGQVAVAMRAKSCEPVLADDIEPMLHYLIGAGDGEGHIDTVSITNDTDATQDSGINELMEAIDAEQVGLVPESNGIGKVVRAHCTDSVPYDSAYAKYLQAGAAEASFVDSPATRPNSSPRRLPAHSEPSRKTLRTTSATVDTDDAGSTEASDNVDTLDVVAGLQALRDNPKLLRTPQYDYLCDAVWDRGSRMPQFAALKFILQARLAADAAQKRAGDPGAASGE